MEVNREILLTDDLCQTSRGSDASCGQGGEAGGNPFAHGVDPSGGFKYMRALYGLVTSGIIAVGVG